MDKPRLGEFEELMLIAISGMGEAAYTVSIQQHLEEKAGRIAPIGSVYIALERLHKKGFVSSTLGPVSPQRGGKRKRFYQITPAGVRALYRSHQTRQALWEGINPKQKWGVIWG